MFERIGNLYRMSNGLAGEFLLRPLKFFREYFKEKHGVLWKLLKYVIALLVYPFAGLVGGVGLIFSWISLIEKNMEVNNLLDSVMQKIQHAAAAQHSHFEFSCDKQLCWNQGPHKHFRIFSLTKMNCREKQREIESAIQDMTRRGILCNCECKGTTANDGSIDFTLFHL